MTSRIVLLISSTLCGILISVHSSYANSAISQKVVPLNNPPSEEFTCKQHRIVYTIVNENCLPKRILSFACQGTCHSYAQVRQFYDFT